LTFDLESIPTLWSATSAQFAGVGGGCPQGVQLRRRGWLPPRYRASGEGSCDGVFLLPEFSCKIHSFQMIVNVRRVATIMGVSLGVAMDSLKFQLGPPCPTLLCPAGRPPVKQPCGRFRGGPPARRVACGHLLPPRTPNTVRLWRQLCDSTFDKEQNHNHKQSVSQGKKRKKQPMDFNDLDFVYCGREVSGVENEGFRGSMDPQCNVSLGPGLRPAG
jgi:hypothetical protein